MASTSPNDTTTSPPEAAGNGGLLKMDTQGRVRISRERRKAILDEFERSGVSGAQFAKLAGIRYSTFAGWVSRRRRAKLGTGADAVSVTASRRPALRLVEALIDRGQKAPDQGLLVHLPGGVRLELTSPAQIPLVIELLQVLQPPKVRC